MNLLTAQQHSQSLMHPILSGAAVKNYFKAESSF